MKTKEIKSTETATEKATKKGRKLTEAQKEARELKYKASELFVYQHLPNKVAKKVNKTLGGVIAKVIEDNGKVNEETGEKVQYKASHIRILKAVKDGKAKHVYAKMKAEITPYKGKNKETGEIVFTYGADRIVGYVRKHEETLADMIKNQPSK